MKKDYLWIGAFVIIIAVGMFFLLFKGKPTEDNNINQDATTEMNNEASSSSEASTSTKMKSYSKVPDSLPKDQIEGKVARIKTVKGEIVFKFFSDSPLAASNFMFLARDGFYDSLTFHRREEGFVIQGGDPKGDGTGGPGYKFNDEPVTKDYKRGIVAMANAGPNTNGSQFFIMLADTPLPKSYTIFGEVTQGMDVVDKITVGDKMEKVTIE